jgi:hypothetical protein
MRLTIILAKLVFFFCHIEGFKWEQKVSINFRLKLKKATTETFEMLKHAYGEECLSRTNGFEWHKRYIETQKVRMQKS